MEMTKRGQTAIEGVFSVLGINAVTRIVTFLRHILITMYIGLSSGLDAFYAALSAVGIVVLVFGDIFDSIGVPRLVKARLEEGEEAFRRVAGNVVRVSVLLSLACSVLLVLLAPLSPHIVPGFSAAQKDDVMRYVFVLVPMAIVYLPYHAMGSVLRSMRQFGDFYVAELISSVAALVLIAAWHRDVIMVPIAWSAGYLCGAGFLLLRTGKYIGRSERWITPEAKAIVRLVLSLLPVYLVTQLHIVVDRTFGSYLPVGSVSALFYALMLATVLPTMLAVENIFVTPLAETREPGPVLSRIVSGIALVLIPFAVFTFRYSREIVSVLFERGMFRESSVAMTAGALSLYAFALPAWSAWATICRVYQILERFRAVLYVSAAGLALNVLLNYLLAFRFGMGLRGIALATLLTTYCLIVLGLRQLRTFDVRMDSGKAGKAAASSLACSAAGILLVELIPWGMGLLPGLAVKGVLYVAFVAVAISVLPGRWVRSLCEEMVWNFRKVIRGSGSGY